jgi:hypothetical protein
MRLSRSGSPANRRPSSPAWSLSERPRLIALSSLLALAVACAQVGPTRRTAAPSLPTIAKQTEGLKLLPGLLDVHVDADSGRVLLEVPAPTGTDGELGRFLYLEGLRTGVGHNDIGLDRGQMGHARVVIFRRLGHRLLIEQPNLGFRAESGNDAAQRAARESFATSLLWVGIIEAASADGTGLVDITDFLLRDAHGVARRLTDSGQGAYRLDKTRSLVETTACLAFRDNLEFEAILTFRADSPGRLVQATVPTPDAVTVVQHLSLVRLPDGAYLPRTYDPRAGSNSVGFQDTTAPLAAPVERSWATRHRLKALDPSALRSRVEEPIVYYVDRGAPQAVRKALIEGASWWASAFDDAGFVDAFQVRLMPEDAHPMDVRYNVIQWVHRSTRGWSYGNSIIDPRTGEIVKGHVSLGSLRIRQDRMIFEGLLGTEHSGDGSASDPVELALARIRQLAAHEVGHTLGFAHNFAASTVRNGSVMDYPAPDIGLTADDELDLGHVYGVGVGPWDSRALFWLYSQVLPGSKEEDFLRELVGEAQAEIPFLSDEDARPAGAAHPAANLWDNGADAVEQLRRTLALRRWAIDRFDVDRVAMGRPLAELEQVFATVYLHHRYQVEAAVKTVGGRWYIHSLNDGAPHLVELIPGNRQREALAELLGILDPSVLDVPERVVELLHPLPPGAAPDRERFASHTSPTFDALGAAATAAHQVIAALLQPERCARLIDQHRRDSALPGLHEVLTKLLYAVFAEPGSTPAVLRSPLENRLQAVQRTIGRVVVDDLAALASDTSATDLVRDEAEATLLTLQGLLTGDPRSDALRRDISRFLARPDPPAGPPSGSRRPPPGSPIGSPADGLLDLGSCSIQRR